MFISCHIFHRFLKQYLATRLACCSFFVPGFQSVPGRADRLALSLIYAPLPPPQIYLELFAISFVTCVARQEKTTPPCVVPVHMRWRLAGPKKHGHFMLFRFTSPTGVNHWNGTGHLNRWKPKKVQTSIFLNQLLYHCLLMYQM